MLDFVGTAKGIVHCFDKLGHRVHRVKGLIGIHRRIRVVVSGNLPPGQIDGLDTGLDLLHGLAAGECTERVDVRLGVQKIPELFGTAARQRVLDREGTA